MTYGRAIIADLLEKRLWPVAALLVVAIVVIPVGARLTDPSPPGPTLTGSAPSHVAALTPELRSLIGPSATPTSRKGRLHDPFAVPAGTSSTTSTAPATTTSSTGKTPAVSTPATPSTSSRTAPATTTGGRTTPKTVGGAKGPAGVTPVAHLGALDVLQVRLRFGALGAVKSYDNPLRLLVLPSHADAQALFLGIMKGGKSAVFLISPHASATGSGKGSCQPSAASCQVVELRPGQRETLSISQAGGPAVSYQLELLAITVHHSRSTASASFLRHHEDSQGRALMAKSASAALGRLTYAPKLGVILVRSPAANRH